MFLHRLALALGKTVAEVKESMTVAEFFDWQRFATEHPFPADLVDMHGAIATALAVNMNRAAGEPPREVVDFLVLRFGLAKPVEAKKPSKVSTLSEADRLLSIF
jgi:hypothetical protein